MKKMALIAGAFMLAAGLLTLNGRGQELRRGPGPNDLGALMKRKLDRSQKLLEGIAVADFKEISKNADDLIFISKQAEWRVMRTPKYEMYSTELRRNAGDLADQARAKNLDGAALAYVELTLTCVKCHKYVRQTRSARLDLPDPPLFGHEGQ